MAVSVSLSVEPFPALFLVPTAPHAQPTPPLQGARGAESEERERERRESEEGERERRQRLSRMSNYTAFRDTFVKLLDVKAARTFNASLVAFLGDQVRLLHPAAGEEDRGESVCGRDGMNE